MNHLIKKDRLVARQDQGRLATYAAPLILLIVRLQRFLQALCLGLHRLEFGKIGLNFIGPLSHREELRL